MTKNPRSRADEEEFHFLFPYRLHRALSLVETLGLSNVASWLPCGTAFKVHNVKLFEELVLPKIGKLSRYKSFLRQLNMYRFKRLPLRAPLELGAYHHPFFRRDHADLCRGVLRGETLGTVGSKKKTKRNARGGQKTIATTTKKPHGAASMISNGDKGKACVKDLPNSFDKCEYPQPVVVDETRSAPFEPMWPQFMDSWIIDAPSHPIPLRETTSFCSMGHTFGTQDEHFPISQSNIQWPADGSATSCESRSDILDEIIATFLGTGPSLDQQPFSSF